MDQGSQTSQLSGLRIKSSHFQQQKPAARDDVSWRSLWYLCGYFVATFKKQWVPGSFPSTTIILDISAALFTAGFGKSCPRVPLIFLVRRLWCSLAFAGKNHFVIKNKRLLWDSGCWNYCIREPPSCFLVFASKDCFCCAGAFATKQGFARQWSNEAQGKAEAVRAALWFTLAPRLLQRPHPSRSNFRRSSSSQVLARQAPSRSALAARGLLALECYTSKMQAAKVREPLAVQLHG